MFESLGDRLEGVFKKFRGQGKLTEENVGEGLREVRLALLEADVNFKVVKDFVERVREQALGVEVMRSLSPGQQVVKIVHEELIRLLGGETTELDLRGKPPVGIMMVGLQGSGKTTSAGKLALWLRREKKMKPYLVPADVYRPAAIDQLTKLAAQIAVPVFPSTTAMNPVDICREALARAAEEGCNVVLFDTAGRLHIDEPLMQELADIKATCAPSEILFVADAMTGQDAVNVAKSFDDRLDVSGVVLTKMDGDARGGAALSIKSVTGKSVKFVGMGEALSEMEVFHPDRIASRILGMGDVLTLIEKAQGSIDEEEARNLEEKLKKASFNFEDFRVQMRRLKKLGSLEGLLKMIPGMGKMAQQLGDMSVPEKELGRVEAMIGSMTVAERENPELLNKSRKARIARGSGVKASEVDQLVKNFEQMRKMMQSMMGGGKEGKKKGKFGLPGMPKMPGLPQGMQMPRGMPGMPRGLSGMGGGMPGMSGLPGMGGMPGMPGAGAGGESPSRGSTKKKKKDRKKKKKRR
ncbi:Signal recognition 54 kDa protein [Desulfovibrio sp. X2]|uniref:signal recognition particle protein n=1 Tax=Desulfovibrio sp. X2 TaxID=941449 RepID=UPI000358757D|nr:signal recognition particle protein [Desulfovibrio sp. X2]EPR41671.1 Signal recognition 54 kDa protein [Desulfovibrio sp. X2]